jgi:hypothetical protein
MSETNLEYPPDGTPPDETDISVRAYFSRISDERLAEYDPRWSDQQIMDWDGNFRTDGALMLVCCERDVEIDEYRTVIDEHIQRRKIEGPDTHSTPEST